MLAVMPTIPAAATIPAPEPVRMLNFTVTAALLDRVDDYAHAHRLRRAPAIRALLHAALLAAEPADQAAAGQLPGQTAITP